MIHRLRLLLALLLTVLLLAGCLPAVPSTDSTAVPSVVEGPTARLVPPATGTLPPTTTAAATPRPLARRVLILSIDGLRPDAIPLAPMTNLLELMQSGAYTLAAQTTYPSATLPATASMLTGMCPSKHGVDWNDYDPEQGFAAGTDLFDLAHAAGLWTVMVVGKEKLLQITEPSSLDAFEYINDRDLVIADYVSTQIIPQGFGLLFINFPTTDWMGHEYGWLSLEYLSVLYRADQALGNLLSALEDAGLRDDTLIIVTADHGGHEVSHGSSLPEDMTIPWVVAGPGVQAVALTDAVSVTDSAATAAWALGLPIPPGWDGIPVYQAFGLPSPPRPEPRCP